MYGFCFTTNVTHDHALLWFLMLYLQCMGKHPLGLQPAFKLVVYLVAYELCL